MNKKINKILAYHSIDNKCLSIVSDFYDMNGGQFEPWMIRTLVSWDLIQTSAMVDSDVGPYLNTASLLKWSV